MHDRFNQSPWLDNLSRELLNDGSIKKLIDSGIRGITSNPTIFEKALSDSEAYDSAIKDKMKTSPNSETIYWQLAVEDIKAAADLLLPIFESSNHEDGYISLEVSPKLALDAEETLKQAQELWQKVNRPNLMIKVPATKACLPVISKLISEGINVNVTLIFSLVRYQEVINAYMNGLENSKDNISKVRSVASFFVSRIDTEVDMRLKQKEPMENKYLQGKAAIAMARLAYEKFSNEFSSSNIKWSELEKRGAKKQRPLWASTSTKNPDYDPLMYITNLIASDTVNTIPNKTIEEINSRKNCINSIGIDAESIIESKEILKEINNNDIDLKNVSEVLEQQGLEKFQDSFNTLLNTLSSKMNQ